MADPVPDAFLQAPPEVIRYFDSRPSRPTFDWRDIAPREHAFAFTVAKTAGYDVLDDIRASVRQAVVDRVPFETFQDQLEPLLRERGWWGRRVSVDPASGTPQVVQLGSPRRLRTIYWANTRSAYAAGEWERIQRTRRFLPFLLYTLSTAERRRPEHAAKVGTVLPADHPWWNVWFPPNGWGCECGTRQIGRREAERLGYDPGNPPDAPPVPTRAWLNKRTGQIEQVPVGIDPGWATNPGRARAQNLAAFTSGRLDAMPSAQREAAVADLVASPTFRAVQGNVFGFVATDQSPANLALRRIASPVAALSDEAARLIGARTRVVNLSVQDAEKQNRHRNPPLAAEDYARLQSLIETGGVWDEGGRDFVFVGAVDGLLWHAVLHLAASRRGLFLRSFRRTDTPEPSGRLRRGRRRRLR